jgi:hypothetical protein
MKRKVAALAARCMTVGTRTGSTLSGANPVTFNWKSFDGVSGTMSATQRDCMRLPNTAAQWTC